MSSWASEQERAGKRKVKENSLWGGGGEGIVFKMFRSHMI